MLGGFLLAGLPMGFILGITQATQWKDTFKKFPAAFGCYMLLMCLFTWVAVKQSHSSTAELGYFMIPAYAVIWSPLLLVGKFLGWLSSLLMSPFNPPVLPPAAQ